MFRNLFRKLLRYMYRMNDKIHGRLKLTQNVRCSKDNTTVERYTMRTLLCVLSLGIIISATAQVNTETIDLRANKDTTVTISARRGGNICADNSCIQFVILLNPGSDQVGMTVDQVPASALYYLNNCEGPYPLSKPACVSGQSSVTISFCKPGNNVQTYTITASSLVKGSGDLKLREKCSGTMSVVGLSSSTVIWESVYPGTIGQYNNYLNPPSGSATTTVTPQTGSPSYIDYRVYGSTISCGTTRDDTIRVYTSPAMAVSITPNNPAICSGASTVLNASVTGGNPPYTYA